MGMTAEEKQAIEDIVSKQYEQFLTAEALDRWGEQLDGKMQDLIEAKNMVSEDRFEEMKTEFSTESEKFQKAIQESFDEFQTKLNRQGKIIDQSKDFDEQFEDLLMEKNEDLKNFKDAGVEGSVVVDLKDLLYREAKADLTQSTAFSNTVVPPTRVPGIVYDPDRMDRIRNFMSVARTSSNAIWFNQETTYNDSTDMVAEGGQYPQSSFVITQQSETVKKIGARMDVSEEMLEDLPALAGYLRARLMSKLKLKEDTQILYGSGAGNQIQGITGVATSYTDRLADSNVNRFDVLAMSIDQAIEDEFRPNVTLINPRDYFTTILTKDSNGAYIFPDAVRLGSSMLTVAGVPIAWNTAVTADDFVTGDFRSGAQLFDRRDAIVEFSRENQDNFEKGMVTVRISERLVQAVYRTSAFIYGDFSTALAQGSA